MLLVKCRLQQIASICVYDKKKNYWLAFVYLLRNLCGILEFFIPILCWISGKIQATKPNNNNKASAPRSEHEWECVAQHILAFEDGERERERTLKRTNIKYEKWLVFEFDVFLQRPSEIVLTFHMWEQRQESQTEWHTLFRKMGNAKCEYINSHRECHFNWRCNVICLSFYCVRFLSTFPSAILAAAVVVVIRFRELILFCCFIFRSIWFSGILWATAWMTETFVHCHIYYLHCARYFLGNYCIFPHFPWYLLHKRARTEGCNARSKSVLENNIVIVGVCAAPIQTIQVHNSTETITCMHDVHSIYL